MAILQLPCVDVVEDTTSNDVSSSDDFQDAPPATGQNKEKKKIDTASSPPHKKQKQVKSVPSSSNIPSRSSLKNTAIPSISISKASKRSLSPVAEHQTKKVVTQKTVKAEIGDLCKLITDNFKSVMEAIKSIKIIEKHINVIFYYLRKKGKYNPPSNYVYTTVDCAFKIKVAELWEKYVDPQSCTFSVREEYVVCEYMNGYRLMPGVPWHTVKERLHWVLVIVAFLYRCLYIYDLYNSAIHDLYVKTEVQKFAEIIPSSLLNIDFYKKKIDIDWQCHPKYRNRDESDPFEVIFVNDIPQQRSGIMYVYNASIFYL
ncbi:hypothetical protein FXO38_12301 [Capsicum annuum]|nr:hypothetical protein FXO38_12301 [Capsicum annuum]